MDLTHVVIEADGTPVETSKPSSLDAAAVAPTHHQARIARQALRPHRVSVTADGFDVRGLLGVLSGGGGRSYALGRIADVANAGVEKRIEKGQRLFAGLLLDEFATGNAFDTGPVRRFEHARAQGLMLFDAPEAAAEDLRHDAAEWMRDHEGKNLPSGVIVEVCAPAAIGTLVAAHDETLDSAFRGEWREVLETSPWTAGLKITDLEDGALQDTEWLKASHTVAPYVSPVIALALTGRVFLAANDAWKRDASALLATVGAMAGVQTGLSLLYGSTPAPLTMPPSMSQGKRVFARMQDELRTLQRGQHGRSESVMVGPDAGVTAGVPAEFWGLVRSRVHKKAFFMALLASKESVAAGKMGLIVWDATDGVWDIAAAKDERLASSVNAEARRVLHAFAARQGIHPHAWSEAPVMQKTRTSSTLTAARELKQWVVTPAGSVAVLGVRATPELVAAKGAPVPQMDIVPITWGEYVRFFAEWRAPQWVPRHEQPLVDAEPAKAEGAAPPLRMMHRGKRTNPYQRKGFR